MATTQASMSFVSHRLIMKGIALPVTKACVELHLFHHSAALFPTFINAMPIIIQIISRTRQMMLTKKPCSTVRPIAAVEIAKPPSCTPSCMGRKPIRFDSSVVSETMRMLWRKVSVMPSNPPPPSMPKRRSMKSTSALCTIRERYSRPKAA